MSITVADYRVRIGSFNNRFYYFKSSMYININNSIDFATNLMFMSMICLYLLLSGDIELNPGPSIFSDRESSVSSSSISDVNTNTMSKRQNLVFR